MQPTLAQLTCVVTTNRVSMVTVPRRHALEAGGGPPVSGPRLRVLLLTDLVGSTDLAQQAGEATAALVRRRHFAQVRVALRAVGGEEVKSTGDGLLAALGSATAALRCAVAAAEPVRVGAHRVPVRVGVSVGEVREEGDDVYGLPVAEAARLCAAAPPGQVACSEAVWSLASERAGLGVAEPVLLRLKGFPAAVPARLVAPGAARSLGGPPRPTGRSAPPAPRLLDRVPT
jgi:class 3 adenylate cyclase